MTDSGRPDYTVPAEERALLADGFGARLRQERKARGLSQRQLSEATSIRRQTIGRFERGELRPRASTVEILSRALRAGRPGVEAETLALELMAAAGASLREDRGQRSRRRRRAVARFEWSQAQGLRDAPWVSSLVAMPGGVTSSPAADPEPAGRGALSLLRDDPTPGTFTRGMLESWPRGQLLDELRKLPWPDQVAAVASALGVSMEAADDWLWAFYAPPGAPSPH